MASFSDLLLEALKPKRMAYSILSLIGEVNSRPIPTSECLEAPLTQRFHHYLLSGKVLGCWISAGFMRGSRLRLAPYFQVLSCIGWHVFVVPLPSGPSAQTDRVYESCPGVEDQLITQRGKPGIIDEASRRLFVGPR